MIQNLKVVDPLTGEFNLTNVFQFTFKLSSLDPLPQILPRTYHEVDTLLLHFFSCCILSENLLMHTIARSKTFCSFFSNIMPLF
jgi:hypothetical protein